MDVPTVTGVNGRVYPARRLTRAERARVIVLAHELVHAGHLSVRAAQAVMAAEGIRRSRGAITNDLARYTCPVCADWPA